MRVSAARPSGTDLRRAETANGLTIEPAALALRERAWEGFRERTVVVAVMTVSLLVQDANASGLPCAWRGATRYIAVLLS
ncbi:hypothetical protein MBOU_12040 [Mycobacterium bourgelatii]|uniref:Uncharacterized protein n=1 Tax=Mycobacterium bourgelatii TaxID=1273442 RepID=A0A7I9YKS8_MYCBU|nr:hypothetical protein MBOU_12040 [Mycobacterium bourgelatii]